MSGGGNGNGRGCASVVFPTERFALRVADAPRWRAIGRIRGGREARDARRARDEVRRTYRVLIDLVFVLLAGDGGGHERALRVCGGGKVSSRTASKRVCAELPCDPRKPESAWRAVGNARPRIGRAWRRTLDAEAAPAPAMCCLAAGTNRDQSALAEVRSMVARARVAPIAGKRAHKPQRFLSHSRNAGIGTKARFVVFATSM